MPTELVEIGFDLRGAGGPFLVLDDPIAGQLDNPDWVLGGTIFIDITDDVTNFTIRRGKSNDIANFSSGEAVVELNNRLRYYDPTYEASPYYGNIIPKRQVRISTNYRAAYTATRTNLVTNPSLETNTTNWASTGSTTFTRITTDAYIGSASGRVTTTGLGQMGARIMGTSRIPVIASQVFTGSVFVKDESTNAQFRNEIYWYNSGGSLLSITTGSATTVSSSAWTRISLSATAPTNATMAMLVCQTSTNVVASRSALFDAALFEQASTLGDYFDGSTAPVSNFDADKTYSWSGTANASTSTELANYKEIGRQYFGSVDDWNLEYTPNGDAVASFVTSDGFADLANTTITPGTATPQFSGARVNAVLDDPTVGWSPDNRNIDTGSAFLGADVIGEDTNALAYIHKVEQSELGRFFIAKDGRATFQDRTVAPSSVGLVELSNTGTGIPYQDLTVMYGSEDLANEIVLTSAITSNTVVANDTDSQNAYGIYKLTLSDLLLNDDTQLTDTALFLASKYSQPKYRFDSLNVRLNSLTTGQQNQILGLELGSVVKVTFLPSNLPPAIVRYAEIIRIGHSVDITGEHMVNFGLATVDLTYLVLDDPVFGMLDTNSNVLGF
jgi:hypothetical protein